MSSTTIASTDDDVLSVSESTGRERSQDGEESTWEGEDLDFSVPVVTKGPKQSELELRFFLQMMLEAHCYEWALVIAIILQDTMSATAALQSVFQDQDMSVDNKRHVATGLEQLMAWAQTESYGYMWIMDNLREQHQSLTELVDETQTMATDGDGAASESDAILCSPLTELEHTLVNSTPTSAPVTPGVQEPIIAATGGPDDSQESCCIS